MKTTLLPLLAAGALLAACAPATAPNASGRIVNDRTGQEGSVVFTGAFRSQASLPSDPDNVSIVIGQDSYSGRYRVIGGGDQVRLTGSIGFGGTFGSGFGDPFGSGFYGPFGSIGAETPVAEVRPSTRPGNLVARTLSVNGGPVRTLTCTFQVDQRRHGIGTCQDSAGQTYSLQF